MLMQEIQKQSEFVGINNECYTVFMNIKIHLYSAATFKIINNNEIVIKETFKYGDINFKQLVNRLSDSEPIYVIYYIEEIDKIVLVTFIPETAKIKLQMIYQGSAEYFQKNLGNISKLFSYIDKSDLIAAYDIYCDIIL